MFKKYLTIILLFSATMVRAQTISGSVEMVHGKPSMVLNGKAVNPMIYALTDVPGGRWSWEELPAHNMKTFCEAGFQLMQVDLFFDHVWSANGEIDLTLAKKQLRGVLDVCPEAAIIIRFHVNPPKWWQKKYPEENTVYADTKAKPDYDWGLQRIIEEDEENPVRTSLASQKWIDESSVKLIEFLRKLQQLPEANAIAGIQVAGGVYGEWHYWGFINNEPDQSLAMQRYFRKWLQEKYKTDASLQLAWKNKSVTLENATVPTLENRLTTQSGIFRNPQLERKTIDYYEAQHTCVADDIIHFCRVIKENWPRPIITGAFYGYFYAVFGREAAGGHLEFQKVIKSPFIDFISAPGTYYPDAVEIGDAYRPRSLITSVRLNGKLWLDEMDQQPPLLPLNDTAFNTSLDKSIAMVRRNVMATASHGAGLWFYDFGSSGFNGGKRLVDHGSWGWWDEPSLMKDISNLKALLDRQNNKSFQRDADVLLVHDTKTFYYTGSAKAASFMGHWTNNWIPPSIYKSGVLHDVIHVDDLSLCNLDQYKAVVFINTWILNEDQKKLIKTRVAQKARNLVFLYAPGYGNEKTLDKRFMDELTGFQLTELKQENAAIIQVDKKFIDTKDFSVWNMVVNPLFVGKENDGQVLGRMAGTNQPAFLKKNFKAYTSWFISLPPDDSFLWRFIFKEAGAHLYLSEGNHVIYGGNGILTIHVKQGGEVKLKLNNGVEKKLILENHSTTLVDSQTGEILLGN